MALKYLVSIIFIATSAYASSLVAAHIGNSKHEVSSLISTDADEIAFLDLDRSGSRKCEVVIMTTDGQENLRQELPWDGCRNVTEHKISRSLLLQGFNTLTVLSRDLTKKVLDFAPKQVGPVSVLADGTTVVGLQELETGASGNGYLLFLDSLFNLKREVELPNRVATDWQGQTLLRDNHVAYVGCMRELELLAPRKCFVTKLNSNGNVLFSTEVFNDVGYVPPNILEMNDGTLVLTIHGYYRESFVPVPSYLAFVDTEGRIKKKFEMKNRASKVFKLPSGKIAAYSRAGDYKTQITYFNQRGAFLKNVEVPANLPDEALVLEDDTIVLKKDWAWEVLFVPFEKQSFFVKLPNEERSGFLHQVDSRTAAVVGERNVFLLDVHGSIKGSLEVVRHSSDETVNTYTPVQFGMVLGTDKRKLFRVDLE